MKARSFLILVWSMILLCSCSHSTSSKSGSSTFVSTDDQDTSQETLVLKLLTKYLEDTLDYSDSLVLDTDSLQEKDSLDYLLFTVEDQGHLNYGFSLLSKDDKQDFQLENVTVYPADLNQIDNDLSLFQWSGNHPSDSHANLHCVVGYITNQAIDTLILYYGSSDDDQVTIKLDSNQRLFMDIQAQAQKELKRIEAYNGDGLIYKKQLS